LQETPESATSNKEQEQGTKFREEKNAPVQGALEQKKKNAHVGGCVILFSDVFRF
jgi:hypothetical protein